MTPESDRTDVLKQFASFPEQVDIREEGPRDGWQNIEDFVIPTATKLEYIRRLNTW